MHTVGIANPNDSARICSFIKCIFSRMGAFDGLKASYKDWKATATNAEEVTVVEAKIAKIVEVNNVVKTGEELNHFLASINPPIKQSYSGKLIRTIDNGLDPLYTHPIPRFKSQRFSKIGEDVLFFSSSQEGNIQELTYWGKEINGKTTTFV